jgi:hypothetical protein
MVLFYVLLFGYPPFDKLDLTTLYSKAHALSSLLFFMIITLCCVINRNIFLLCEY